MLLPIVVVVLLLGALVWLRRGADPGFADLKDSRLLFLAVAQALVLALQVGSLVLSWARRMPQPYPDFIVGEVGVLNQNKSAEYYALYAALVAFLLLFFFIARLYRVFIHRGKDSWRAMLKLSLYALIPAVILAGQTLRSPDASALLTLASSAILLSLATAAVVHILVRRVVIQPRVAFETGAKILLGAAMLLLSDIGVAVALSRVKFTSYYPGTLTLVAVIGGAVFLLIRRNRSSIPFRNLLNAAFYLSQVGVPLLFTVMASPPVLLQSGAIGAFRYRPLLYVVILALIVASLVDIYRRFRRSGSAPAAPAVEISPFVLFAVLVYLHASPHAWPHIDPDDYHAGEYYLPWRLLTTYGYLPFVDYQPARGLINYVPGFLSWLFFDNTASGQAMVIIPEVAVYVFIAFWILRLAIGDLVAFLASASLVLLGTGPPTGALLAVCGLVLLHHVAARGGLIGTLWLWIGLSILLPLFTIAEGSVFVVAALPVGLFTLFQAFRAPRSRSGLFISLSALVLAGAFLALLTPAWHVMLAAVRYLAEQSSVNEVAHGIIWMYPEPASQRVTSGSLWQIVRFSWLLIVIPVGALLLRAGGRSSRSQGPDVYRWLFLVSLLIMAIVFVPRAAGRIDAAVYSRLGAASTAIGFGALPVVLFPGLRDPGKRMTLILATAFLFGVLGDQAAALQTTSGLHRFVMQSPAQTVSGSKLGLADIGSNVVMDPKHLERQLQIREVLGNLLGPDETYYDLTNHNSDYAFQGRPSPVAETAFYNVPSAELQRSILAQLEAGKPPLALVGGENLIPEWSSLPLRAFSIYKYLLANYTAFADQYGRVWMIRRGSENRLVGTAYSLGGLPEQVDLLEKALAAHNLSGLPASWGRSMTTLRPKLSSPLDLLSPEHIRAVSDLEPSGANSWTVVGPHPSLVLDVDTSTTQDMLYVKTLQEVEGGNLKVFWTDNLVPQFSESNSYSFDAGSTAYLIPLSAAPSWELGDEFAQLRMELPATIGQRVQFTQITLYSRSGPD